MAHQTDKKPCNTCKLETAIQCIQCKDNYCNNVTKDSYSHIILHLTKCNHNQVKLLNPLICSRCRSKNVFDLGFISDSIPIFEITNRKILQCKSSNFNEYEETISSDLLNDLVCRNCCYELNYMAIIYDGSFIPRILPSYALLDNDESAKKDNKEDVKIILPPVQLVYTPNEYKQIFTTLIDFEYERASIREKAFCMKNVKVRFQSRKEYIRKFLKEKDFIETINYYLFLDCKDTLQYCQGGSIVNLVSNTCSIYGVMMNHSKANEIKVKICKVSGNIVPSANFIFKCNPYPCPKDRMLLGITRLNKMDSELAQNIYGKGIFDKYSMIELQNPESVIISDIPSLPRLNNSQILAIRYAIENKLVLIQGPPGTGKTVTAAAIVYNLIKMKLCKKILIVANNNTAVNNITEKIYLTGINVVRVVSHIRGSFDDDLSFLSSNYLAKMSYYVRSGANSGDAQKPIPEKILIEYEKTVIRSADVITTTAVNAGKNLFNGCVFSVVIMDEASQSTEPVNLIPLIHGCKKLVLIGDHKQLGPFVIDEELETAGFDRTLFERFINLKYSPILLDTQYRMHPNLSYLPSLLFYDGRLKNGITEKDRICNLTLPFPTFFYACFGREEIASNGVSTINQLEADQCFGVVNYLIEAGIKERDIGIITAYEGQRNLLLRKLSIFDLDLLEIKNVDGYQGREKNYIILCTVRSNSKTGVGFLSDERRINVGITRAKYGLVIIGNPYTLYTNKTWFKIVKSYNEKELIFAGEINNLKPIKLVI